MYEPRWDIPADYETPQFKKGKKGEARVRSIQEKIANRSVNIEVKTDSHYIKSRRWLVEYRCLGDDGKWHPSGIFNTQSEVWTFVAMNHDIMFSVGSELLRRAFNLASKDKKNWFDGSHLKRATKGIFVTHEHFFLAAQDEPK